MQLINFLNIPFHAKIYLNFQYKNTSMQNIIIFNRFKYYLKKIKEEQIDPGLLQPFGVPAKFSPTFSFLNMPFIESTRILSNA